MSIDEKLVNLDTKYMRENVEVKITGGEWKGFYGVIEVTDFAKTKALVTVQRRPTEKDIEADIDTKMLKITGNMRSEWNVWRITFYALLVFCLISFAALLISPALAHDAGYSRKLYGGWLDRDRDCYNTRAEVLIRDNTGDISQTTFGCRIVSGLWKDAYDGQFYQDAGILDIDHLVPLSEVHKSGGYNWGLKKRREFANDEENLYVTHRSINRSKGGKGIDKWLPPTRVCDYLAVYIKIKEKYNLSLRASEVRVLLSHKSCII